MISNNPGVSTDELRRMIAHCGMTRKDLCERAGIRTNCLFRIENNLTKAPYNETMMKLLRALGDPRWELYTEQALEEYLEKLYERRKKYSVPIRGIKCEFSKRVKIGKRICVFWQKEVVNRADMYILDQELDGIIKNMARRFNRIKDEEEAGDNE